MSGALDRRITVDGSAAQAILAKGLCARFTGAKHSIQVLKNINLSVAAGEIVGIVGPSGCGKTTLLRMLAGLLAPHHHGLQAQGRIDITIPHAQSHSARNPAVYLAQQPCLLPWRTVLENIRLPAELARQQTSVSELSSLAKLVALDDVTSFLPHQLSGGMQQRVAIARALLLSPPILLLDEPFSALDEVTRDQLNRQVTEICRQRHLTVLFVTHRVEEAVLLSSSKVIVLSPRPATVTKEVQVPNREQLTSTKVTSAPIIRAIERIRATLLQDRAK